MAIQMIQAKEKEKLGSSISLKIISNWQGLLHVFYNYCKMSLKKE